MVGKVCWLVFIAHLWLSHECVEFVSHVTATWGSPMIVAAKLVSHVTGTWGSTMSVAVNLVESRD